MQILNTITVQPEILAGNKFGGWALNRHCRNIGGFKFGGSVRDLHTYNYMVLGGRKLDRQTAKFSGYIYARLKQ